MRTVEVEGLGTVSKIGLGTWQFGSREWGYGENYAGGEAHAIVRRALDLGVTLFDTAEIYGFGKSERILGKALGADRNSVTVATKVTPVAPVAGLVKRAAKASAKRIGLDSIPLYQVHWPNPVIPDAVVMQGPRQMLDEGLVQSIGVSNYSLRRWIAAEQALGQPVVSNQVHFSLAHLRPLWELVPWAADNHRMVVAYSPLEQGLLGGRYDENHRPTDLRAANPLFLPENLRLAEPLLRTLREVGGPHDAKPAQVALAWLLYHEPVVAIPGAHTVEQLEANVAAADIELADDEYEAITEAARAFHPETGPSAYGKIVRGRVGL
ncbi:MAG: oxidoreductase [Streptosporangiales bacterium]|nr:oxidoreductase [Streptosporangiales bacterium]